ncbi:2,3-dihydro-2,3-dihydroxybenzoate dehydrogenase [Chitinimonas sp. BJB300]|uniref:2,3-dihydro-2,3-dihydroxybenzoate dehydrogenase n=1 Tax=Chitinimonas sp. BJB300 TaxID=1559339 RepID=UPI000C0F456C|nr:2,3-dihydro-2,3-dihydroxybenzoate dehydrogenase [Chitinimonas sp. BJB300]PHV11878.1 2,3-dihydro-2,3-dihydroxybenzoate dehydrogenase [Chitinimonas sp. BJB300]TSJ87763.1 2,3-dihydro-2,3-dihydroxybenzoate dehydrogenase [Chitinimonas sp. BJB300]
MEFAGKVALVSGAAQGIGAAVAHMLAAGGATVALLDRDAAGLTHQVTELQRSGRKKALALPADLRDGMAINAAVVRCELELGAIDILVNVAGILRPGSILGMSDTDWADTFAVNTTGPFQLCRAVAQGMVRRGRGAIVTVGSNAAAVPRLNMAAYCASKAATAHFMRCLALELAPHGVRCNTVSPGSTHTAMQRQLWTSADSAQKVIDGDMDAWRLGIPLGRIADPDDIAEAVCFLASDRARQITMHDLRVDGGATLAA